MEENKISLNKNVAIIRYPPLPPNSVSGIKIMWSVLFQVGS